MCFLKVITPIGQLASRRTHRQFRPVFFNADFFFQSTNIFRLKITLKVSILVADSVVMRLSDNRPSQWKNSYAAATTRSSFPALQTIQITDGHETTRQLVACRL